MRPALKPHLPLERPAPLQSIAVAFKDASTVELDPNGKKQHLVEVFNLVDEGSSVLWEAVARDDYNAETVVETLFEVFEKQGLPRQLRFDRDPRFVGSASSRDFPATMVRMLHVLGVQPAICPPHRPDKNGFVERYNRSFKYECLLVERPTNLAEVKEATLKYQEHYNHQRPHRGRSCGNQPPRVAFAELPVLPSLPLVVDPDSWLSAIAGEHFSRKVRNDGSFSLDKYDYYLSKELAGKYIVVVVDALKRELVVNQEGKEIKRLSLKGMHQRVMSLNEYRQVLAEEARSERRGWRPTPASGPLKV